MNLKKSKNLIIKLVLLLIGLFLLLWIIQGAFARFKSSSTINPNIETALYVFKEDYQQINLTLSDIYPRAEPFTYSFTISNTDGTNTTETYLDYDIDIQTTTNLPLKYEMYLNEEYSSTNAKNIMESSNIEQDEYGTYFQKVKLPTKTFGFEKTETNTYQLVVYFPEEYKDVKYQDITDAIIINVNSKQKM